MDANPFQSPDYADGVSTKEKLSLVRQIASISLMILGGLLVLLAMAALAIESFTELVPQSFDDMVGFAVIAIFGFELMFVGIATRVFRPRTNGPHLVLRIIAGLLYAAGIVMMNFLFLCALGFAMEVAEGGSTSEQLLFGVSILTAVASLSFVAFAAGWGLSRVRH